MGASLGRDLLAREQDPEGALPCRRAPSPDATLGHGQPFLLPGGALFMTCTSSNPEESLSICKPTGH